jgi:hypothetical protein
MDGITYVTHRQTVYLKADKSPLIPPSARHWTVSSTTGDHPAIDPKENAAFLETLPGRIVTVPMLHHFYHSHVMTVLLLVWIYALCCRFLRPRHRIIWLYLLGSSCLFVLVHYFAYDDWFRLCVLAVTTAAALYGGLVDAMGPLTVLTLAHEGWTITAIPLTIAYAVWAKDDCKDHHLPDFATFFARLRPSPQASKVEEEEEEEEDDHGCLVCWSSDGTLLQLPCHEDHKVCRDCLSRMCDANEYRCPFCRKALFTYKSESYMSFLGCIITTTSVLIIVLRLIMVALLLYKGHYRTAAIKAMLSAYSVRLERNIERMLTADWDLANARASSLWLLLGFAVVFTWSAIAAVHTWDQVTLWDGAMLKGVEVWDTHGVVRQWSSAATSA